MRTRSNEIVRQLNRLAVRTGAFLFLMVGALAYGQQPPCDVAAAADREARSQAVTVVRLLGLQVDALKKIQDFMNSKHWTSATAPMESQMSVAEAATYERNQHRYQSVLLASLYESKRARDIEVIARLARLADQTARYGFELPSDKESKDVFLLATLGAARELHVVPTSRLNALKATEQPCSLESSLRVAAYRALYELSVKDIDGASKEASRIEKQYGLHPDPKSLSAQDRALLTNTVLPIIAKAKAQQMLAQDLIRLSDVEGASKKLLASWKEDQFEAPGDWNYTGTTWARWTKDHTVSADDIFGGAMLTSINEHIPSEISHQMEAQAKTSVGNAPNLSKLPK